jgi:hypothetical protein
VNFYFQNNEKYIPLTTDSLMAFGGNTLSFIDDDQETILNVAGNRNLV